MGTELENNQSSSKNTDQQNPNREYKSDLFTSVFSERAENVIDLFNMLQGTHYDHNTPVRLITLKDALFRNLRDDLAFVINGQFMVISEHQSAINPNMPLRCYEYSAKEYIMEIDSEALHRSALQRIPTPKFVVFYNGNQKMKEPEQTLYLSNAFIVPQEQPMLELTVRVINLNHPANRSLIAQCKLLKDYVIFVKRVREYLNQEFTLGKAIALASEECIREDILKDYLLNHEAEVAELMKFSWDLDDIQRWHEEELAEQKEQVAELSRKLAEKDTALTEKDTALTEKDAALIEKDAALIEKDAALAEKDILVTEMEAEIAELKRLLAAR